LNKTTSFTAFLGYLTKPCKNVLKGLLALMHTFFSIELNIRAVKSECVDTLPRVL